MGLINRLLGKRTVPKPATKSQHSELSSKFPFPVQAVRGDRAESELLRLRQLPGASSFPVIVGDFEHAVRLLDVWNEPFDYSAQLKAASSMDVLSWFTRCMNEEFEDYDEESQNEIHEGGTGPMTRLSAGYDYHNHPIPEVFIAMIPTSDATTIPLHLRFGDWNACPSPSTHVAVARYWRERFGAEIATLTSDVIEFTVARTPNSDDQAAELAMQQYLYCHDIVDQGVGSVATLARALRDSTRWYFWWD